MPGTGEGGTDVQRARERLVLGLGSATTENANAHASRSKSKKFLIATCKYRIIRWIVGNTENEWQKTVCTACRQKTARNARRSILKPSVTAV